MLKNKHIVILTPGFPENESDSTCIPTLRILVKAIHEISGYDVTVVTLHYPSKKRNYIWNGIPVYAIGSSSSFSKLFFWHDVILTLKKIHYQKPITLLHSFWLGESTLLGHWFSIGKKINHITTLMGQDALKGNTFARLLPLKKMEFITISHIQQQVFYQNYKINSLVIECGISRQDFHHSTEKTIDIIDIGSLIPLKNHDLFINVIYKLSKVRAIKAVLIGDGILEEKLRKKIALLNLENTIEVKGKLDYEETLKYLAQSKILLHTTNYEGFGLVFAEALHSKTMIISKNVGGAILSENWTIADTEDKMVDACEKLLSKTFTEEPRTFFIEDKIQEYLAVYDK